MIFTDYYKFEGCIEQFWYKLLASTESYPLYEYNDPKEDYYYQGKKYTHEMMSDRMSRLFIDDRSQGNSICIDGIMYESVMIKHTNDCAIMATQLFEKGIIVREMFIARGYKNGFQTIVDDMLLVDGVDKEFTTMRNLTK